MKGPGEENLIRTKRMGYRGRVVKKTIKASIFWEDKIMS